MALIDKNETEARRELLMAAFEDAGFQDDVKKVAGEINAIIEQWVGSFDRFDQRIDNVFSVQGRVKEAETFAEKLFRKNYIWSWDVTDNIEENQETIRRNLPDLIGVRVNCYFAANEVRLYNRFQQTQGEVADMVLDFEEGTEQANKLPIDKFSGLYRGRYHFEVQIKSIVHNVWGEVEHKTVYKNPTFDGYIDKKREITQALYSVLQASDKELLSIFTMQESEEQLIRSLFFCQTKHEIEARCNTNILASHYERYFNVFGDITQYRQFVAAGLMRQRRPKVVIEDNIGGTYDELINAVEKEFPHFYLKCLYEIDSIIHQHSSYEAFLKYMMQHIFHLENDDYDEDYAKGFGDDEDEEQDEKPGALNTLNIEDCLNKINSLLKCRLTKNKKKA